jgi:hypothetical protein
MGQGYVIGLQWVGWVWGLTGFCLRLLDKRNQLSLR